MYDMRHQELYVDTRPKYLAHAHKNVHLFRTDGVSIPNRTDTSYSYADIAGNEFKPTLAGRVMEMNFKKVRNIRNDQNETDQYSLSLTQKQFYLDRRMKVRAV